MRMRRRSLVTVGAAAALITVGGLVSGVSAAAPAPNGPSVANRRPVLTPVKHAKPAFAPNVSTNQSSPWAKLRHAPPFPPGSMLLASDGTVLVHAEPESGGTNLWYKLTPDSHGSYADGTWSQIASMPASYNPLYFSSAILPDGRMIVEGGEYLGGTPTWTNKGAIYNPVTDTWRSVAPPAGWTNIGDAMGIVLSNGTYMQQQACQNCTSSNPILSTALRCSMPPG